MYLRFRNFNLKNQNVYTTVRRGVKWSVIEPGEFGYECVEVNKEHDLDLGIINNIQGFAEPLEIKVCRFCDISEKDICDEHDESCRTVSGLFNELSECYCNFSEKEIVTIIRFRYHD
jgi:hypothetical protein